MSITYNKLIRDKIPQLIEAEGKKYSVRRMDSEEYLKALKEKLIEEANEAALSEGDDLIKELADLREVISALQENLSIDEELVLERMKTRANSRGKFEERLLLEWVEG